MKKIFKTFLSLLVVVFVLASTMIPAFAVENSLILNGVKGVKAGDIVTYTLMLSDCKDTVAGFQMYINYDKDYLEVVPNTLKFPELENVFYNDSADTGIIFNYSNATNPAEFATEKVFATVDFKVRKEGETDITFFVGDLYGLDMSYFKTYTFTYDLAVNGEVKVDGKAPVITTDKEFIDQNQGQFINYVDGKGEENGGKNDKERETVKGVTQAPSAIAPQDVTKEGESDITTFIVIIVVVLLVCAIVILVILRKALTRGSVTEKTDRDDENNDELKNE